MSNPYQAMHVSALKTLAQQRKEYVVIPALYGRAVALLGSATATVDGGMDTLTRYGNGLRLMDREGYYVTLLGGCDNYTLEVGHCAGLEVSDHVLHQHSLRLF